MKRNKAGTSVIGSNSNMDLPNDYIQANDTNTDNDYLLYNP